MSAFEPTARPRRRGGTLALLPRPTKRILSAAEYLGYAGASNSFYARIKELGVAPLWTGAFDRESLDRALDRASGPRDIAQIGRFASLEEAHHFAAVQLARHPHSLLIREALKRLDEVGEAVCGSVELTLSSMGGIGDPAKIWAEALDAMADARDGGGGSGYGGESYDAPLSSGSSAAKPAASGGGFGEDEIPF